MFSTFWPHALPLPGPLHQAVSRGGSSPLRVGTGRKTLLKNLFFRTSQLSRLQQEIFHGVMAGILDKFKYRKVNLHYIPERSLFRMI